VLHPAPDADIYRGTKKARHRCRASTFQMQPIKFDLAPNLNTANSLNLVIPPALLA